MNTNNMKRTYQKPESEIIISTSEYILQEMSPGEIDKDHTLINENNSFDESEEGTPSSSSLWD